MLLFLGGVAHLGERLNGIQEVRGSIPLISTIKEAREYLASFIWRHSSVGESARFTCERSWVRVPLSLPNKHDNYDTVGIEIIVLFLLPNCP